MRRKTVIRQRLRWINVFPRRRRGAVHRISMGSPGSVAPGPVPGFVGDPQGVIARIGQVEAKVSGR